MASCGQGRTWRWQTETYLVCINNLGLSRASPFLHLHKIAKSIVQSNLSEYIAWDTENLAKPWLDVDFFGVELPGCIGPTATRVDVPAYGSLWNCNYAQISFKTRQITKRSSAGIVESRLASTLACVIHWYP